MDRQDINHPNFVGVDIERMISERGGISGTIIEIDNFIVQPNNLHCALVVNRVLWYALRLVVYKPPYRRLGEKLIIEKISEHFIWEIIREKAREIKASFNRNDYNLVSTDFLLPQFLQSNASYLSDRRILEEPDEYIKPFDVVGRVNLLLINEMIYHVGIYLGNKKVCHIYFPLNSSVSNLSLSFSISSSSDNNAWVRIDDWERFVENGSSFIFFHSINLSKSHNLIIRNLKSSLQAEYGKGEYNIFTKNCEHFANLVIHGINLSNQVKNVMRLIGNILQKIESVSTQLFLPQSIPYYIIREINKKIIEIIFEESKNIILRGNDDELFENLEIKRELTDEESQIFQQLEQQALQEQPTS